MLLKQEMIHFFLPQSIKPSWNRSIPITHGSLLNYEDLKHQFLAGNLSFKGFLSGLDEIAGCVLREWGPQGAQVLYVSAQEEFSKR